MQVALFGPGSHSSPVSGERARGGGRKEGREEGGGKEKVFNSLVWSRFAGGMVGKFRMPFGNVFFFFILLVCLLFCLALVQYGVLEYGSVIGIG